MRQLFGHRPRRYSHAGTLVVATALAWWLGAGAALGDGPATDGVLVLRNGNVLSGSIRRTGDVYRIESQGGILQVPAGQVERFAPSLTAAYEARRQERVGGSADAHVELARWCLQLGLHDLAARELLDARTLEPGHRGAAHVELQLRQAIEGAAHRESEERSEAMATSVAAPGAGVVALQEPTIDSIAFSAEIPADARAQFVRSIQPMLLQSCATSGCHQPGSSQTLQLDRWALVGKGNADIVRRNLAAVLRELDVVDPTASPLLHMARSPHGRRAGGASRPLTARQATLLVDWLNDAAGVQPAGIETATGANGANVETNGVELAVYEEPLLESLTEQDQSTVTPAVRFQPRDAFDPEIFNRRFAELAAAFESDAAGAAATEHQPEQPERSESEPQPTSSPSAEP